MGGKYVENGNRPVSPVSWNDMFHSASKLQLNTRATGLFPSFSSPALHYNAFGRSADDTKAREMEKHKGDARTPRNAKQDSCKQSSVDKAFDDEDKQRVIEHYNPLFPPEESIPRRLNEANFQLAIYIAMAHAGLALVVVVLYGVGRLLEDFWKPIQWAVLCSMPLREVQEALVKFWNEPLQVGFVESLVAPPIAIYKALAGTVLDARDGFLSFVGKGEGQPRPVGFAKLFQWLVSFAFFTLGLEYFGPANLSLLAFVGLLMYAAGTGLEVGHLTGALSQNGRQAAGRMSWVKWAVAPIKRVSIATNQRISRSLASSLHTLVAVGLIIMMILGSVGGLALFSYKVGLEGKDAVVMLKVHLEESNYAEVVGFNKWLEENKVPELIDNYVVKGYDALMHQVDAFAAANNLTEVVDVGKEFLMGVIHRDKKGERINKTANAESAHPLVGKLRGLQSKMREFDVQGIMLEIEAAFLLFLEHFQIKREDFMEKAKVLAQSSSDVGKKVIYSGTNLVASGASMLIFVWSTIASGAAGLFNFLTQTVVFFSVLYYLITSSAGGVMEQILDMVPLSETTRKSCANVLDHTVSSVLLATVKTAFFQASFTWLLFRFADIHFLYGSTLIALVQAVLPLFPNWVASIPMGIELAMEGYYVLAIVLMCVHIWVMDFGVDAIHSEIPGHNAYLTGLSIAGGMALFTPALEGAIMGPLLMTVLIATKNLYGEFVLNADSNK
ncbi:hypothetical protein MPTK1_7g13690 [Marchantia polymorpha subsp. ruderalis]|uniref:Uncharacterized protein n=2 Tax=Marchantia polymorpha TaxID=3197 RepID=A0A176VPL9_MARPO|nr:hypothetical protein AXG93_412s1300 [Marchantia polymorpha subsp. ruderalis]PTQ46935.1 hypothetical protein MARPO_0009s0054 [Marchantia polymorpha]BBN17331.1 hypothetical protein Mp_7g13690 [Marchantia polymorpha subsp. ruderalis]|eukprot:PTQ46935.1 hypothetical protein MARPO_0009s0054 [Marchantia polymorpha]